MITEPAKTFSRMFRGYDPAAVDAYIEVLLTKQQLLLDEVNNLRARLNESGDGAAALRIEVACLKDEVAILSDTSPSPYAMQHRMAKMLRRAGDEGCPMDAEARGEAEAETTQRERRELLADMAAQRKALETKCEETSKELDFELARMRAETQSEIDDAWQAAQREREQLLAEAREQARQAVDEATQQRIMILEELMGVAHDLEGVPASLESAYQGRKNPPEASVVVPLDQKNQ